MATPNLASASSSNQHGTPTATTPLAKLRLLVPILAGFNHRNKNQHRHARWWAAFSAVRRNVGRLIADFETAAAASSSSKEKKRKRHEKEEEVADKAVKQPPTKEEERARWTRDHVVPEAYLVFSQLAADNQFAVLGIVLFGVLASVRDACVQIAGESAVEKEDEQQLHPQQQPAGIEASSLAAAAAAAAAGADEETTTSVTTHPVVVSRVPPHGGGGTDSRRPKDRIKGKSRGTVDSGQVVSREEVAAAAAGKARELAEPAPPKRKRPDVGSGALDAPVSRRKADKKPVENIQEKEKTKKKKRKGKGDEFDNLFSSLF